MCSEERLGMFQSASYVDFVACHIAIESEAGWRMFQVISALQREKLYTCGRLESGTSGCHQVLGNPFPKPLTRAASVFTPASRSCDTWLHESGGKQITWHQCPPAQ
jgi:hypothetical protein